VRLPFMALDCELLLRAMGVSMDNIHVTVEPDPDDATLHQIRSGLRKFNVERVGVYKSRPFAVVAHREDGAFVGGMYGWLQWGWLYVDLAWVHEDYRGRGIGRQLLHRFEVHAKQSGITKSRLNTASFQGGLAFYKRCGYEIYAELEIEAPDGASHVDYFMRKSLID
jgi:ribosomal protein S18 acetylase RimI-like enzyme